MVIVEDTASLPPARKMAPGLVPEIARVGKTTESYSSVFKFQQHLHTSLCRSLRLTRFCCKFVKPELPCRPLTIENSNTSEVQALYAQDVLVVCDQWYYVEGTPFFNHTSYSSNCSQSGTWTKLSQCLRKLHYLLKFVCTLGKCYLFYWLICH